MKPTVKTRKSAPDRKAEIVETAIRLAAELGPDRVTTQILADEIGVTQPAIFRHFPAKGLIWTAVAERITRKMQVGSAESPAAREDPADYVLELVTQHLDFIQRTPAIPAILFSRELHSENEDLRIHFEALMDNRQKVFSCALQAGIDQGAFSGQIDPDACAYLMLSLIQGLAMRWSLSNRKFDLVGEGRKLAKIQIASFL